MADNAVGPVPDSPGQILSYLQATTITYQQWLINVQKGRYNPKDGSTTYWGLAIKALEQLANPPHVVEIEPGQITTHPPK